MSLWIQGSHGSPFCHPQLCCSRHADPGSYAALAGDNSGREWHGGTAYYGVASIFNQAWLEKRWSKSDAILTTLATDEVVKCPDGLVVTFTKKFQVSFHSSAW